MSFNWNFIYVVYLFRDYYGCLIPWSPVEFMAVWLVSCLWALTLIFLIHLPQRSLLFEITLWTMNFFLASVPIPVSSGDSKIAHFRRLSHPGRTTVLMELKGKRESKAETSQIITVLIWSSAVILELTLPNLLYAFGQFPNFCVVLHRE